VVLGDGVRGCVVGHLVRARVVSDLYAKTMSPVTGALHARPNLQTVTNDLAFTGYFGMSIQFQIYTNVTYTNIWSSASAIVDQLKVDVASSVDYLFERQQTTMWNATGGVQLFVYPTTQYPVNPQTLTGQAPSAINIYLMIPTVSAARAAFLVDAISDAIVNGSSPWYQAGSQTRWIKYVRVGFHHHSPSSRL
jgi:hypothetical protein